MSKRRQAKTIGSQALDKDKDKRRKKVSRDGGEGVWPGASPGQGGEVWAATGLPVETEPGGSVTADSP